VHRADDTTNRERLHSTGFPWAIGRINVPAVERRRLSELKRRYVVEARPLPRAIEAELSADPRAGAKAILAAVARRRAENRSEGQRLRTILRYEQELWSTGVTLVAGVDEAGMSPLAGPVVAAAVILPIGCKIAGVDDSKRLDPETRESLAPVIKSKAVAWAIGSVDPEEIDRINIYHAGLLAMRRAIEGLAVCPQQLLLDARKLRDVPLPQRAIIKGDQKSLSIAAASILAKTTRDRWMVELDAKFPGYGFAQHKGYPVRQHYRALEAQGICPIHRKSFPVIRQLLGLPPIDWHPAAPSAPARPRRS
jgi:ribonuclease HII